MSTQPANEEAKSTNIAGAVAFNLAVYDGPLDLLLHLLKRAEVEPHEVTAKEVTDQYLRHLELLRELNLDVAGEYLVMAATLLLIKSFALLPHPDPAQAEEIEESRRDLVARLLEYQRYREAAARLSERPLLGRDLFAAPGEPVTVAAEKPAYNVSVFDLVEAMGAVLRRLGSAQPRNLELHDIPIAQCIPRILTALEEGGEIEFMALFEDVRERAVVIATFIALLELCRRGEVRAFQEHCFGPIKLSRVRPAPEAANGSSP